MWMKLLASLASAGLLALPVGGGAAAARSASGTGSGAVATAVAPAGIAPTAAATAALDAALQVRFRDQGVPVCTVESQVEDFASVGAKAATSEATGTGTSGSLTKSSGQVAAGATGTTDVDVLLGNGVLVTCTASAHVFSTVGATPAVTASTTSSSGATVTAAAPSSGTSTSLSATTGTSGTAQATAGSTAVPRSTTATASATTPGASQTAVGSSPTPPVVVPSAHTGEPWAGWVYWLLIGAAGVLGVVLAAQGATRRHALRRAGH